MRWLILFTVIFVFSLNRTQAQETTQEPPAPTPVYSPVIVTTIDPDGDGDGQTVIIDYTVTAGETILSVLLLLILITLWGAFLWFAVKAR